MSELRSAVDSLRAEVLPELPDARIEEDFSELWRAVELAQLEILRRLADLERRRVFERDGHLSMASWLVSRFRVAWGAARDQVRVARALQEMPRTRRAFEAGDVSLSGVRVLTDARDADPDAFRRSERQLVDAARIHSIGDLRRVAAFWRQQVEREQLTAGETKRYVRAGGSMPRSRS
jgi:hypothetical protein